MSKLNKPLACGIFVSLMLSLCGADSAPPENLLLNGDLAKVLESARSVDDAWKPIEKDGNYTLDKSGPDGNAALVCTALGENPLHRLFLQGLPLDPAKTYVLTIAMKTEDADASRTALIVNKGWKWGSPAIAPAATSDWKDYSVEFKPDASDDSKYSLVITPQKSGSLSIANLRLAEKK